MALLGPLLMPLVLLFGAVAAAIGVPVALADPERRMRRIALFVVLAGGAFLLHGELRSFPVVHGALLAGTAVLAAVLFALSLRRYLLRRVLLAERPRSPDEWSPGEPRRLWAGMLEAIEPLTADDGRRCVYRRIEVDRWDRGRWRRIAAPESCAEALELAGRSRRMALSLPRAALRRAAREVEAYRVCPHGWRLDPDPDPAALYRMRTLAVLDGTRARVLARAERRDQAGLILRDLVGEGFHLDEQPVAALGRQAGLLAAAALLCTLAGIWTAWR